MLGDTTESSVVNEHDRARAEEGRREDRARPRSSSIGTTGDTTAAQAQLDSFIEKWKTEHVDTVFLSGDLASTKQFVQKLQAAVPERAADRRQHRRARPGAAGAEAGVKPNPYEGLITAGGLSPQEYDDERELEVLHRHLPDGDRQGAPRTPSRRSRAADGKIDDTYGTINDACQTLTMFHDIGEQVGQYLNNANWMNTVDHFGPIENRGSGPYSSLHTGKYSADDNWRLQAVRLRARRPNGNWKPITPLENITG